MKGIKQIKNYRLVKEIGKGTSGTVYEAVDDKTTIKYAIKAIPSSRLTDKQTLENFKREIKLLNAMNHDNIIKIHNVEKTANNVYLVLEHCNGGNLYEYSRFYRRENKKPMPEVYVQNILRQIIQGLEYMHNFKVIHRDIKLENVLLHLKDYSQVDYRRIDIVRDRVVFKIADLGYAKELEANNMTSTICGTPITMAPDIIKLCTAKQKEQYDYKVDLWSLGAITYELLVGHPPFYASDHKQIFAGIMNGTYSLPKNMKISIEAVAFINGLLQFSAEDRLNWNNIKSHPFIVNDTQSFHLLNLNTVGGSDKTFEINTRDKQNIVWSLFQNLSNNLQLEKIGSSVYHSCIEEAVNKERQVTARLESNNNLEVVNNKNTSLHTNLVTDPCNEEDEELELNIGDFSELTVKATDQMTNQATISAPQMFEKENVFVPYFNMEDKTFVNINTETAKSKKEEEEDNWENVTSPGANSGNLLKEFEQIDNTELDCGKH